MKGQLEAIERALNEEAACEKVLHLIAGIRGAMARLMAEVVEDHVRTHLVDAKKYPGGAQFRSRGATPRRRSDVPEISSVRFN